MPKFDIQVSFLGKKYNAKGVVAKDFEQAVKKVKDTFKVTGGKEVENEMPDFDKNNPIGDFHKIMDWLTDKQ